jgi:hypothetical protein
MVHVKFLVSILVADAQATVPVRNREGHEGRITIAILLREGEHARERLCENERERERERESESESENESESESESESVWAYLNARVCGRTLMRECVGVP